jgi:hypothetical protein
MEAYCSNNTKLKHNIPSRSPEDAKKTEKETYKKV